MSDAMLGFFLGAVLFGFVGFLAGWIFRGEQSDLQQQQASKAGANGDDNPHDEWGGEGSS